MKDTILNTQAQNKILAISINKQREEMITIVIKGFFFIASTSLTNKNINT